MHGNDSWLTLVLLFAVFVLLPQLTKFIKVQPEKKEEKPKMTIAPADITPQASRSAELIKTLPPEHSPSEPTPQPIKPRWF